MDGNASSLQLIQMQCRQFHSSLPAVPLPTHVHRARRIPQCMNDTDMADDMPVLLWFRRIPMKPPSVRHSASKSYPAAR